MRPRFVWGRGDTTLLPVLVEGTRSGAFRWVGGGRHLTSTTHVENTVEGLLCAAEHGRGGRAYFVTDGDPLPFRDFVGELIATQGVTPPEGSVPTAVARALAATGETAWKLLPLRRRAAADALRRPGSPRRSARSTTRAPAPSSATRRSSRARPACASCATRSSQSSVGGASADSRQLGQVAVLLEADLRLEQQRQLEHRRAGLVAQALHVRPAARSRARARPARRARRRAPRASGRWRRRCAASRPRPACSARGRAR